MLNRHQKITICANHNVLNDSCTRIHALLIFFKNINYDQYHPCRARHYESNHSLRTQYRQSLHPQTLGNPA